LPPAWHGNTPCCPCPLCRLCLCHLCRAAASSSSDNGWSWNRNTRCHRGRSAHDRPGGGSSPGRPALPPASKAYRRTPDQAASIQSFFATPGLGSRPASSTPATGRSAGAAGTARNRRPLARTKMIKWSTRGGTISIGCDRPRCRHPARSCGHGDLCGVHDYAETTVGNARWIRRSGSSHSA
jgi:hypothetical protein